MPDRFPDTAPFARHRRTWSCSATVLAIALSSWASGVPAHAADPAGVFDLEIQLAAVAADENQDATGPSLSSPTLANPTSRTSRATTAPTGAATHEDFARAKPGTPDLPKLAARPSKPKFDTLLPENGPATKHEPSGDTKTGASTTYQPTPAVVTEPKEATPEPATTKPAGEPALLPGANRSTTTKPLEPATPPKSEPTGDVPLAKQPGPMKAADPKQPESKSPDAKSTETKRAETKPPQTKPEGSATPRTASRSGTGSSQAPLDEPRRLPSTESTPTADWSPEMERLRQRMGRVLEYYKPKRLNTRDHNSWEMMHAIIAYGTKSEVSQAGPTGAPLNTIGYLCYNHPAKNQRLFQLDRGNIAAKIGVGVQGHPAQFLAIVAQSRLPASYPMLVEGKELKISDLIESEKRSCQTGTELTFTLISMSYYLDTDEEWENDAGQKWSISKLIQEEIKSPIRGAACGGSHRLTGLAYALRKREIEGRPIDGQFARAQKYLNDYHNYTFSLQNTDGSFSTEWFVRRGNRDDLDRRVQTTGHMLEWLVFSLPENQLDDRRVISAVNYLTNLLYGNREREWEIGPKGHALHALAIYDQRRFHHTAIKPAPEDLAKPTVEPRPLNKAAPDDETDQPSATTADRRSAPSESSASRRSTPSPAGDNSPAKLPEAGDNAPAAKPLDKKLSDGDAPGSNAPAKPGSAAKPDASTLSVPRPVTITPAPGYPSRASSPSRSSQRRR
ncbi:MAG: hypothetical protein JSS27_01715 [Planctomycetes bacterium]|nr:hypothetical protein [Planctomycetota bacterium]